MEQEPECQPASWLHAARPGGLGARGSGLGVSKAKRASASRCGLENVQAEDGTVEWVAPESKERFTRRREPRGRSDCLIWNRRGEPDVVEFSRQRVEIQRVALSKRLTARWFRPVRLRARARRVARQANLAGRHTGYHVRRPRSARSGWSSTSACGGAASRPHRRVSIRCTHHTVHAHTHTRNAHT